MNKEELRIKECSDYIIIKRKKGSVRQHNNNKNNDKHVRVSNAVTASRMME